MYNPKKQNFLFPKKNPLEKTRYGAHFNYEDLVTRLNTVKSQVANPSPNKKTLLGNTLRNKSTPGTRKSKQLPLIRFQFSPWEMYSPKNIRTKKSIQVRTSKPSKHRLRSFSRNTNKSFI